MQGCFLGVLWGGRRDLGLCAMNIAAWRGRLSRTAYGATRLPRSLCNLIDTTITDRWMWWVNQREGGGTGRPVFAILVALFLTMFGSAIKAQDLDSDHGLLHEIELIESGSCDQAFTNIVAGAITGKPEYAEFLLSSVSVGIFEFEVDAVSSDEVEKIKIWLLVEVLLKGVRHSEDLIELYGSIVGSKNYTEISTRTNRNSCTETNFNRELCGSMLAEVLREEIDSGKLTALEISDENYVTDSCALNFVNSFSYHSEINK